MNDREPGRPDPEDLLSALDEKGRRSRRGRLKVFLGMCPGVGKTYAMLRAARGELADGTDVVAAIVETHGRLETAELLSGLPTQPTHDVPYRGTTIRELDLDGLLARRPALALVDELAHSNAPGSRHPKRWQDVVELLESSIDVFTTLNIQHVESRAEAVRQITGIEVRETVPDKVLDLADGVELVDLTPEALLERLRDGKVYLGDRADDAARGFFREEHLNALRELALRFTAERVDRDLRALRSLTTRLTVWRSGERLLVGVGPSPFSTRLVRWTRRLAAAQGAAWLAVHVEGSTPLSDEARRLLDRNLALARDLGAEIIVTHDDDVAAALVRVAVRHNATQIVVGRPVPPTFLERLTGGSLVDRLLRAGFGIDVYVVPSAGDDARRLPLDISAIPRTPIHEYALAGAALAGITLTGLLLPGDAYLTVGLVYLLAVVLLSLRVGRWPLLFAGLAGALFWNFLFIPPRFTFTIQRIEDAVLFAVCVVAALTTGQLTARIRAQGAQERRREARATALFELTRGIAEAPTFDAAVQSSLDLVARLFGAGTALLVRSRGGDATEAHFAGSRALDDKERSVAGWALRHSRPAGRFTDTLPGALGTHFPLVRGDRSVGVLSVFLPREASIDLSQRDLLEAFARQLALAAEREQLRAAGEREKALAESDRLHRVLLDSVSHELRTPLSVIAAALEQLPGASPADAGRFLEDARRAHRRLDRLVGNLLDQTRLESGALRPRSDWCDARDLVNAALDAARDSIAGHAVEVSVPEDLPPVRADFALTEQALTNLLLNAAHHTPPGTPVFITAGIDRDGSRSFFTIADRGPGLPESLRERLFQKFARGDVARAGGLGLGLSLVRGFIHAQGGEVVVGDQPGGGAVFTLYLPRPTGIPPARE